MNFDINTLRDIVLVLVPMILSLTIHEFAHAWSAHKLGDDTALSQGRMTLNPLPHIDLFGTILIPVISVVSGGIGLIGWAKPVPISPHRFRRSISMRNGMIVTALAGPFSNILLAFLVGGASMFVFSGMVEKLMEMGAPSRLDAFIILGTDKYSQLITTHGIATKGQVIAALLLSRIFIMNVGLAIFNMLPIPPLDGSRVLPLNLQVKLARYAMVVFVLFILAINFFSEVLSVPILLVGNGMLGFWSAIF